MITSLLLKATAIVLIGLASARLARGCRASVRHAILMTAFAAMAVLPLAVISLPNIRIDAPALRIPFGESAAEATTPRAPAEDRASATAPVGSTDDTATEGPGFSQGLGLGFPAGIDAIGFAVVVWFAGAVAFLIPLAIGVWRVARLRRTALPAVEMQSMVDALAQDAPSPPVDLLVHEALTAPITCGVARAAIIVPPDASGWSAAALRRALVHELEHVQRRDWPQQLFARVVCAVYWFNPLVWMAYRQLCLNAEHACDDAVVAREESTSYAEQLVTLARGMSARAAVPALGMAHRSDLAARVSAVLDATRARGRAGLARTALIALAFAVGMLAIAPLQVSATDVRPAVSSSGTDEQTTRRARVRWLDRALVEAADEGDVEAVRELLDQGADVDAAVDGDGTALIVAAREGHLQLVRLLLDRGADVNQAVSGDGAPLIMAAREGHLDIVQLLLDRGADVELIVPDDENALIQASGAGHLAVAKLLVSRGANVNARAWADTSRIVIGEKVTTAADGSVEARGTRGETVRLTAAQTADQQQGEWRTPLSMAVRGGHRAVVAFLRSAGAIE